jgi:hypothetical protein
VIKRLEAAFRVEDGVGINGSTPTPQPASDTNVSDAIATVNPVKARRLAGTPSRR